jgi:outer membrane lipoprotein-sorting protein
MRIRQAVAAGLLALTPALTGCLSLSGLFTHTRSVLKTRPPDIVRGTSLDELLKQVNDRYSAIQSMTASVQVVACTGGASKGDITYGSKGEITCYPPFGGHIVIGKPENLLFLLEAPVLGSRELDMVSDGKSFKMLLPHYNCAIVGSDVVTNNPQTGLFALRPAVILDSLLIRGLQADQDVAMTQDSRIVPDPKNHKVFIDEPTYNLEFLSKPEGQVAQSLRVIDISRTDLLPFQQDIYNTDGKVATLATYKNYQKFGDIKFPTLIEIQRPLDELTLTITVVPRGTSFNQKLEADQFTLDIPTTTAHITNMDDPASASVKDPCAVHAPPSTH